MPAFCTCTLLFCSKITYGSELTKLTEPYLGQPSLFSLTNQLTLLLADKPSFWVISDNSWRDSWEISESPLNIPRVWSQLARASYWQHGSRGKHAPHWDSSLTSADLKGTYMSFYNAFQQPNPLLTVKVADAICSTLHNATHTDTHIHWIQTGWAALCFTELCAPKSLASCLDAPKSRRRDHQREKDPPRKICSKIWSVISPRGKQVWSTFYYLTLSTYGQQHIKHSGEKLSQIHLFHSHSCTLQSDQQPMSCCWCKL